MRGRGADDGSRSRRGGDGGRPRRSREAKGDRGARRRPPGRRRPRGRGRSRCRSGGRQVRRSTWRDRNDAAAAATRLLSPAGAAGASGRGRKLLIPRPEPRRRPWTTPEPGDGGRAGAAADVEGPERRRGGRHTSPFALRSRRCLREGSKALNPPSSNLPTSVDGAGAPRRRPQVAARHRGRSGTTPRRPPHVPVRRSEPQVPPEGVEGP